MTIISRSILLASAAIFLVSAAQAGPEKVKFPTGYNDSFVRYHAIDKTSKRFGSTHRIFFINKVGLDAVKAGKALPNGTVIIREDWFVKTDDKKKAIKDANGKFTATKKKGALIMEKGEGWGEAYPAEKRNGNWEYAIFKADGSRNTKANTGRCFGCHMRVKGSDFVFSMKELRAAAKK